MSVNSERFSRQQNMKMPVKHYDRDQGYSYRSQVGELLDFEAVFNAVPETGIVAYEVYVSLTAQAVTVFVP